MNNVRITTEIFEELLDDYGVDPNKIYNLRNVKTLEDLYSPAMDIEFTKFSYSTNNVEDIFDEFYKLELKDRLNFGCVIVDLDENPISIEEFKKIYIQSFTDLSTDIHNFKLSIPAGTIFEIAKIDTETGILYLTRNGTEIIWNFGSNDLLGMSMWYANLEVNLTELGETVYKIISVEKAGEIALVYKILTNGGDKC